jgi:hypothetical protein
MSRKRKSRVSQVGASDRSGDNTRPGEQTVRRRKEVQQLILSPGIPDQDRLRSVVREWLVPLLVRQFLSDRGIELPTAQNKVISGNLSTRFLAKEHVAKARVTRTI